MKIHVHFVDDSRVFIASVKRALSGAGRKSLRGEPVEFSFEGFSSPGEYKTAILSSLIRAPDVILLDLSMHGDDRAGIDLAKPVRDLYPSAKIIMFTLMDDAETVTACMNAGVDNFDLVQIRPFSGNSSRGRTNACPKQTLIGAAFS